MPNYIRSYQPGGCFFFTLVTHNRQTFFNQPSVRLALREAIKQTRKTLPFHINALVLLPDHIHAILTLPSNDTDYSKRWGRVKALTTKRLNAAGHSPSIWQKRFWEHQIRSAEDFNNHVDYIHINPVKHGLVNKPIDWPYSTFKKYLKQGLYNEHWGINLEFSGQFGE